MAEAKEKLVGKENGNEGATKDSEHSFGATSLQKNTVSDPRRNFGTLSRKNKWVVQQRGPIRV